METHEDFKYRLSTRNWRIRICESIAFLKSLTSFSRAQGPSVPPRSHIPVFSTDSPNIEHFFRATRTFSHKNGLYPPNRHPREACLILFLDTRMPGASIRLQFMGLGHASLHLGQKIRLNFMPCAK